LTIQETSCKYDLFINVREDQVLRPDGQARIGYATVNMKPGVAILPIDSDGIISTQQLLRP